jgi:hypothetical protein
MATKGPKAEVIAKRGDLILQLGKSEPGNTTRNILVLLWCSVLRLRSSPLCPMVASQKASLCRHHHREWFRFPMTTPIPSS